jgi:thiol-disulfide isomerase/thioredoxin
MLHPNFERAGIEYTKVDIDANAEEADKARIKGVPTIVITKDNGEEIRIVGFDHKVMKRVKKELGISE